MEETVRDEAFWIEQYRARKALWITDENPLRPHALLTSGKHSGAFFNSRRIIPDEPLLQLAARDLVDRCGDGDRIELVDRVVGPATGATKLAAFIADEIALRRTRPCYFASPTKEEKGDDRLMVFDDPDRKVMNDEIILLCEDVITTGGSVARTEAACVREGGVMFSFALTLVNRLGRQDFDGKRIFALIDRPMPIWTREHCPLCKNGSKAILAKDPLNWEALNAVY